MFPASEDEARQVYWDDDAHKFRDVWSGRFVSYLEGVQSLTVSTAEGEVSFQDMYGNAVPDPAELIYRTNTFTYGQITREWNPTLADVYSRKAPSDGYYVTMALYRDDDGNLKIVNVYNKIGAKLNFDDEQRRIAAAIAKAENIGVGEEGSDQVLTRAIRLFHYLAQ